MESSQAGQPRRWWLVLVLVALPLTAALLYRPVVGFELMGDDYQWWQQAHLAMHRPLELLGDLDTFYRPASTWTLVLDRIVFGDSPAAFHATNVALHVLAGLLLVAVARRLGLGRWPALVVGLLWTLSPFSDEPAISVAIRFQDLLFAAWLLLALSWPGRDEEWSVWRVTAVTGATFLAAMSKETWVVTAGLVVAFELARGHRRLRRLLWSAAPFAAAAAAYTAVSFLAFPGGKNYFSSDPGVLAKVPHELAAFLELEQLVPVGFQLDWKAVVAVAITVSLIVYTWRRRNAAGIVGSVLLILPTLPTLLVPYLPTRYTAIPYAGFLLLVAGTVQAADGEIGATRRLRLAVRATPVVLAGLVGLAGWMTVRGDLVDYGRISEAHRRLLQEARACRDVPVRRPFLVVRGENENPLAAIARTPKGLPKLLYVRQSDPYGLIDAAALFEWTVHRERLAYRRSGPGESMGAGLVLVHRAGGFVRAGGGSVGLDGAVDRCRQAGMRYRLVRPLELP